MTQWILIYWLWTGDGVATGSVRFQSKAACETATVMMENKWKWAKSFCAEDKNERRDN